MQDCRTMGYEGDHLNHIADRIRTKTLPFFSEQLVFE